MMYEFTKSSTDEPINLQLAGAVYMDPMKRRPLEGLCDLLVVISLIIDRPPAQHALGGLHGGGAEITPVHQQVQGLDESEHDRHC